MSRSTAIIDRNRSPVISDLHAHLDGPGDRLRVSVRSASGVSEPVIADIAGAGDVDDPRTLDRCAVIARLGDDAGAEHRTERRNENDSAGLSAGRVHRPVDGLMVQYPESWHD